jgi:hypothetical protein
MAAVCAAMPGATLAVFAGVLRCTDVARKETEPPS